MGGVWSAGEIIEDAAGEGPELCKAGAKRPALRGTPGLGEAAVRIRTVWVKRVFAGGARLPPYI